MQVKYQLVNKTLLINNKKLRNKVIKGTITCWVVEVRSLKWNRKITKITQLTCLNHFRKFINQNTKNSWGKLTKDQTPKR